MMLDSDVPPSGSYDACIIYSGQDYWGLHCLRKGIRRLITVTNAEKRSLRLFHLCHKRNRPDYVDISRAEFQSGMDRSNKLVLIASPESAASHAVSDELRLWVPKRSPDDILIVHTRGRLAWDSSACDFEVGGSSAINPALKGQFTRRPPVFDMTWVPTERGGCVPGTLYRALLRDVAASILGCHPSEIAVDLPPNTWHWGFVSER